MIIQRFSRVALVAALLSACAGDEIITADQCTHALTQAEREAGWQLLFDGSSLEQWRSYQEDELAEGWQIENGCLARVGWAGDIITRRQFGDFELSLEWRISPGGNSGIFVRGDESGPSIHHSGIEMQILDNAAHSDGEISSHRAGEYYDMMAAPFDTTVPPLTWQHARILARGSYFEFWLNGRRTAAFDTASEDWRRRFEASKFADRPRYGTLERGHIGLQDHWDKVWFRNIKVRPIGADGEKRPGSPPAGPG